MELENRASQRRLKNQGNKMYPKDTELSYWTCPCCDGEQEIILVANLELPPGLVCEDCGHESGLINWEVEE